MSWDPVVNWLHDGQTLHLHQGPIDLLIRCEGAPDAVSQAYLIAQNVFSDVLITLVEELELLRMPISSTSAECKGAVAVRMQAACNPFSVFNVTPMAAVAGSVADHILSALSTVPGLSRSWVNNGGDIAIYLTEGQRFDCGIVDNLQRGALSGHFELSSKDNVGGVATSGRATSGQGGRSFSLGIADAVTVLASSAAVADVAATLIANQVDLPGHHCIERVAANQLDPDSDLGSREVTTAVAKLHDTEIDQALNRGCLLAEEFLQQGHIHSALLSLQDKYRKVQSAHLLSETA